MIYVLRAGDRYIRSSSACGDELWTLADWLSYIG